MRVYSTVAIDWGNMCQYIVDSFSRTTSAEGWSEYWKYFQRKYGIGKVLQSLRGAIKSGTWSKCDISSEALVNLKYSEDREKNTCLPEQPVWCDSLVKI